MDEKALVISIGDKIEAVHFEKEECKSCTTGCAKIKNSFEISNPMNFEIKKGSVVLVRASKKAQAIQGILSAVFQELLRFVLPRKILLLIQSFWMRCLTARLSLELSILFLRAKMNSSV